MRISALQPGYLPWLGFFEQMYKADLFVFHDDTQFTKGSWRARNRIKSPRGAIWLTVPIKTKGRLHQTIRETKSAIRTNWQAKHWKSIEQFYRRAPFFNLYRSDLREFYQKDWEYLLDLDLAIIEYLCHSLSLKTPTILSSSLDLKERDKNVRGIEICKKVGASEIYEGQAGKDYFNLELWQENDIRVEFQNYQHPCYHQLYVEFIPYLSVIDLLFNHGPESLDIIIGKKVIEPSI